MVLVQIYLEAKVKDLIFLMKILGWILGLPSIQIQIIGLGILPNNYYVKDSYTLIKLTLAPLFEIIIKNLNIFYEIKHEADCSLASIVISYELIPSFCINNTIVFKMSKT